MVSIALIPCVQHHVNPLHDILYIFLCRMGLNLVEGVIRDSKKAGVLEPVVCKVKCLKFATEAAITILRIDDMIKLAKKQEDPHGRSYQDAVRGGHL